MSSSIKNATKDTGPAQRQGAPQGRGRHSPRTTQPPGKGHHTTGETWALAQRHLGVLLGVGLLPALLVVLGLTLLFVLVVVVVVALLVFVVAVFSMVVFVLPLLS